MQTIFDIVGTFLLIVAVGIATYYGIYFYGTLTQEEKD